MDMVSSEVHSPPAEGVHALTSLSGHGGSRNPIDGAQGLVDLLSSLGVRFIG